jgi:SAM-dependent methyltransferase
MEFTGERLVLGSQECDEKSDIYMEHMERYRFAVDLVGVGDKILDIACGMGYGAEMMATKGAAEVWGGDIDQQAIKEAKGKYKRENLHFRVMEVTQVPFEDNYFDLVVSFETIEHIDKYLNFIKEIKRVLKPGGQLIISTPDRKISQQLDIQNPFHKKEFIKREMVDLLQTDFREIKCYGQRGVRRMKLSQKLFHRAYSIYHKLNWLSWLKKFMPQQAQDEIGEKIKRLDDNFKVERLNKSKAYLYLIFTCYK